MTSIFVSRDAINVIEIETHENFPGSNSLLNKKVGFNVENVIFQLKNLIENTKKI